MEAQEQLRLNKNALINKINAVKDMDEFKKLIGNLSKAKIKIILKEKFQKKSQACEVNFNKEKEGFDSLANDIDNY